MKSLIVAASALAVAAVAAPAFAQDSSATAVTGYVNLGYSYADTNGLGLNQLDGRAGFKVGRYIGAEAELGLGIGNTGANAPGTNVKIQDDYAGYVVAHLPVAPNAELFARGGYGYTNYHFNDAGVTSELGHASWNFGAGGEYFLAANDGVRLDYTREEFRDNAGHANVWGVSWVHRFR